MAATTPPKSPHSSPEQAQDLGHISVADLTRLRFADLSPAARKIAQVLLADYPIAGLETAAALGQRAGVSTPTVIRFVAQLGFTTYGDLQAALRREVQASLGSPARQYDRGPVEAPTDAFLLAASRTVTEQLEALFSDLSPQVLDRVSRLLADTQRRVSVVGGRFSRVLAAYLGSHLRMLRPGVSVLGNDDIHRVDTLASVRRGDVLVIFDYRRYDVRLVRLAQVFREGEGEVVLFTDPWFSPVAAHAADVLVSQVSSLSPFDSLVPAMAAVELVVARVTRETGAGGRQRIETFDLLTLD